MIVKYTYRCPKCGDVKVQECQQDYKPNKTEIIKTCDKCRRK